MKHVVLIVLGLVLLWPTPLFAGPVEWVEVPQTQAGQQWWDRGSVRLGNDGMRTVLSRFTPAVADDEPPRAGSLYVMQIDCAQQLYRDKQVNGLPRFRAEWQPAGSDGLIDSVINAVCSAPLPS